MLRAWAAEAKDPGIAAIDWLDRTGAPGGIEQDFSLDSIWPEIPEDQSDDGDVLLETDYDSFINYSGFDEDEDAWQELLTFCESRATVSIQQSSRVQGRRGRTTTAEQIRSSNTCEEWQVKRRIILDCKQSGLSAKTRRRYKIVLPKSTDAVRDALILLSARLPPEEAEIFVLDFTNAFWNVPLHSKERKWFVGRVRGKWLVYNTTAQGSRNGPLAWCTLAGLLSRLTQGLFCPRQVMRMQTYVDDPAITVMGIKTRRDQSASPSQCGLFQLQARIR